MPFARRWFSLLQCVSRRFFFFFFFFHFFLVLHPNPSQSFIHLKSIASCSFTEFRYYRIHSSFIHLHHHQIEYKQSFIMRNLSWNLYVYLSSNLTPCRGQEFSSIFSVDRREGERTIHTLLYSTGAYMLWRPSSRRTAMNENPTKKNNKDKRI